MKLELSVVICTHNPTKSYLNRVLFALQGQKLAIDRWELLIVDNASNFPVENDFDVSWHPNGRNLHEPKLGLAMARVRGIRASQGQTIVFVDDDNVLEPTFLEECLAIASKYSFIGAWGGCVDAQLEGQPPSWTLAHMGKLAIRNFNKELWSNDPMNGRCHPVGAGLCIRKEVATRYVEAIEGNALREALGRRGRELMSGEDTDLILTASELGMGWGVFPQLRLKHLIPPTRLNEDYLLRLTEGLEASSTVLALIRGDQPVRRYSRQELWMHWLYRFLRFGRREAKFFLAAMRGRRKGLAKFYGSLQSEPR